MTSMMTAGIGAREVVRAAALAEQHMAPPGWAGYCRAAHAAEAVARAPVHQPARVGQQGRVARRDRAADAPSGPGSGPAPDVGQGGVHRGVKRGEVQREHRHTVK